MESERPGAEMNKQEWETVIEAGGFCWPYSASPSWKLRYPSGLPRSVLDSESTEGPF